MKKLSLLLTLLAASLVTCGPPLPERPEDRPATLIFAVDGLNWDLLLPAMRDGRAPNLLDLARRGSAARLTTFEPTSSPIIWTSIATGKGMEKHGITRFAQRVGHKLVPVTSNQRLVRAFWNILGDAGHSIGVVGWWVTWPAEQVEGWMVSAVTTIGGRTWKGTLFDDLPDQTWPPELLTEIKPAISAVEETAVADLAALLPPPSGSVPDWVTEFRRDLGWSVTTDRIFQAAAEEIIKNHHPRVMAIYQGAVDVGGHRFWGFTDRAEGSPTPNGLDEAAARQLGAYLPNVLEQVDAALGRLRALMPPETDIIVVSDHGMHKVRGAGINDPTHNPMRQFNTGAHGDAPDGIWIAAGPSFRAPKPPFSIPAAPEQLPRLGDDESPGVFNILPTLLHVRGMAVAEDMDGQVMTPLLVEGTGRRPVKFIATHESGPAPAVPPRPISTEADEDVLERLRSLGYIE